MEKTEARKLLKEYSRISFETVKKAYAKEPYDIKVIDDIQSTLQELIDSGVFSNENPQVKKMLSETLLDIKYAHNRQNITSIRMAQYIKNMVNKNIKG